jgi:ribonuclease-3
LLCLLALTEANMIYFLRSLFRFCTPFEKNLRNILGYTPGNLRLYQVALSHRSVKEGSDQNNERLEFLGDAVLSSVVADYLFKRYPYKGEGFLTEMRSKMVNRATLNEIALKMGLKKLTYYNKGDSSLKISQIFGNTLEAMLGAIYLEKGYVYTSRWITKQIIVPHFILEDLESVDINQKNKIYGWASKNGKLLEFLTIDETIQNGRRLFTVAVTVNGDIISTGKAYNKKDAGQQAAQTAIEILGIL